MPVDVVKPWETPAWDEYVSAHPGATVFHTSAWCRIVADIGRYRPRCLIHAEDGRVKGILPAMEIRSRLTGDRLGVLPFSDECFPLADDAGTARALIDAALSVRDRSKLSSVEMRGAPIVGADGVRVNELATSSGLRAHTHFYNYLIPLQSDTDAIRMTFQSKMRQTIGKSERKGVTVRRARGDDDIRECYRLYVLNRRRHGIPPQPFSLYQTIAGQLRGDPGAIFYLASYGGRNVASLVVLRFKGVTTGKYEGIDPAYRAAMPIHPLLWTSIREAAEAGDHTYDLGRTARDNPGLNEFKSRWGARRVELPYFYHPDTRGLSVVRNDSLRYRAFTATVRSLPYGVCVWLGGRIFRHFG